MATIAFITGANSGIGEAVAHQLAKKPDHHVIIGSRKLEAGAKVAADITAAGYSASSVQIDLSSDESIAAAVKQIQKDHGKLDILVNNAGAGVDPDTTLSTREIFKQDFNVNVFGTAVLTDALLPLLRQSKAPRVVFVSTRLASITLSNDKSSFWYHMDSKGYSSSKAALNRLVIHYARVLSDAGGLVNAVCPGLVKTKMSGFVDGGATPEQGAKKIVEMALLGPEGSTATFVSDDGAFPW